MASKGPIQSLMGDESGSEEISDTEIDSFILDGEMVEESSWAVSQSDSVLLPDYTNIDPETQERLQALLQAAGISKLQGLDTKGASGGFADPEILRRLSFPPTLAAGGAIGGASMSGGVGGMTPLMNGPLQMPMLPGSAGCASLDDMNRLRHHEENRSSSEPGDDSCLNESTEDGESLLSLACSAGYYELAQVLLAMHTNVEDRGVKGECTPLMEAASAGHLDIVKLLIQHNADVNAQSTTGNTPLMYACAGGHAEVVRALLDTGADVDTNNENGHTPLMEAASMGNVDIARLLVERGAAINTHSNEFKESPLTLGCYKGHLDMVRYLLEVGQARKSAAAAAASPAKPVAPIPREEVNEEEDEDSLHRPDELHTALMEASMDGHVEVARLLLDNGAQVNMPADSFESPLTLAACGGHTELAKLLLDRGANIEEVNDEGYTPLMEAAREGHEDMVALLLSYNADFNAQTEETGETAMTLACCSGFLEVAALLYRAGASLEMGANTPLMEAAQEGHLDVLEFLIKENANVNAVTATGDSALTYAAENGHTDVCVALVFAGADIDHEAEGGRTALMKAARAGHTCTVSYLLAKGAAVNKVSLNNEHTALSLACSGGFFSTAEILLQSGADPNHKLKDSSTMVIEAAKGGHTNVVQLLLDWPGTHRDQLGQFSAAGQLPPDTAQKLATLLQPGMLQGGDSSMLAASTGLLPQFLTLQTDASGSPLLPVGLLPQIAQAGSSVAGISSGSAISGTGSVAGMGHLISAPSTGATNVGGAMLGATSGNQLSSLSMELTAAQLSQPGASIPTTSNNVLPDDILASVHKAILKRAGEKLSTQEVAQLQETLKAQFQRYAALASARLQQSAAHTSASPTKASLKKQQEELNACVKELSRLKKTKEIYEELERASRELLSMEKTEMELNELEGFIPTGTGDDGQGDTDGKEGAELMELGDIGNINMEAMAQPQQLGIPGVTITRIDPISQAQLAHYQQMHQQATAALMALQQQQQVNANSLDPASLAGVQQQIAHLTAALQLANVQQQQQQQQQSGNNITCSSSAALASINVAEGGGGGSLGQMPMSGVPPVAVLTGLGGSVPLLPGTYHIDARVAHALLAGNGNLPMAMQALTTMNGAGGDARGVSGLNVSNFLNGGGVTSGSGEWMSTDWVNVSQSGGGMGPVNLSLLAETATLPDDGKDNSLDSETHLEPGDIPDSPESPDVTVDEPDDDDEENDDNDDETTNVENDEREMERGLPEGGRDDEDDEEPEIAQLLTDEDDDGDAVDPTPTTLGFPSNLQQNKNDPQNSNNLITAGSFGNLQQAGSMGVTLMNHPLALSTVYDPNLVAAVAAAQSTALSGRINSAGAAMFGGIDGVNNIMAGNPATLLPAPSGIQKSNGVGGMASTGIGGTAVPLASLTPNQIQQIYANFLSNSGSLQQLVAGSSAGLPMGTASTMYPSAAGINHADLLSQQQYAFLNAAASGLNSPYASVLTTETASLISQAAAAGLDPSSILASSEIAAGLPFSAISSGSLIDPSSASRLIPSMVPPPTPGLGTKSQQQQQQPTMMMMGDHGKSLGIDSGHYQQAPPPPPGSSVAAAGVPGRQRVSGATNLQQQQQQLQQMQHQNMQHAGVDAGSIGANDALVAGTASVASGPGGPGTVDLNTQTESNHDTALTLACHGGHDELVLLLLQRGADIEHRDKKGFTPLMLAATAGHTEVVQLLLDQGANIESQSERTKDTALSLACSGGRKEVVEVLLKGMANKEHRNASDYTPLSLAASGGYVDIIALLLSYDAEINSRTGSKLGISPLMLAAMNGHTQAVKLLLEKGSDINAQIETNRNTALTLACFQGRHEVVKLLLEYRATVEHRAKTGLTPLMEAASGGYVEVGRVLIIYGADVNAAPVPSSKDTALTIAADKGHAKFVELLLSHGAAVDVRNKKGNTPLWLASNGGHFEVVQLLVNSGASLDCEDNRKVTPLMAAFRRGHVKVVKWLVKHVTQFPSDPECVRFIGILGDKENNTSILAKCQECMKAIIAAKDRQAAEANKNARNLLQEIEKEEALAETRRAAKQRQKEKKKRKRQAKKQIEVPSKGKSGKFSDDKVDEEDEDDDEDSSNDKENDDDDVVNGIIDEKPAEEEEERVPRVVSTELLSPRPTGVTSPHDSTLTDRNSGSAALSGTPGSGKLAIGHGTGRPSTLTSATKFNKSSSRFSLANGPTSPGGATSLGSATMPASSAAYNGSTTGGSTKNGSMRTAMESASYGGNRRAEPGSASHGHSKNVASSDGKAALASSKSSAAVRNRIRSGRQHYTSAAVTSVTANTTGSSVSANHQRAEPIRSNVSTASSGGSVRMTMLSTSGPGVVVSNGKDRSSCGTISASHTNHSFGQSVSSNPQQQHQSRPAAFDSSSSSALKLATNAHSGKQQLQQQSPRSPNNHENDQGWCSTTTGKRATWLQQKQARCGGKVGKGGQSTVSGQSVAGLVNGAVPAGSGHSGSGDHRSTSRGLSSNRSDDSWKDGKKKPNKMIISASHIARVIGRGGNNINAIRESTGAFIEVDKQQKGEKDRQVTLRGSMDAVRHAVLMINGLILEPDAPVQDIVTRVKRGSPDTIAKFTSPVQADGSVIGGRTIPQASSRGPSAGSITGGSGMSAGGPVALMDDSKQPYKRSQDRTSLMTSAFPEISVWTTAAKSGSVGPPSAHPAHPFNNSNSSSSTTSGKIPSLLSSNMQYPVFNVNGVTRGGQTHSSYSTTDTFSTAITSGTNTSAAGAKRLSGHFGGGSGSNQSATSPMMPHATVSAEYSPFATPNVWFQKSNSQSPGPTELLSSGGGGGVPRALTKAVRGMNFASVAAIGVTSVASSAFHAKPTTVSASGSGSGIEGGHHAHQSTRPPSCPIVPQQHNANMVGVDGKGYGHAAMGQLGSAPHGEGYPYSGNFQQQNQMQLDGVGGMQVANRAPGSHRPGSAMLLMSPTSALDHSGSGGGPGSVQVSPAGALVGSASSGGSYGVAVGGGSLETSPQQNRAVDEVTSRATSALAALNLSTSSSGSVKSSVVPQAPSYSGVAPSVAAILSSASAGSLGISNHLAGVHVYGSSFSPTIAPPLKTSPPHEGPGIESHRVQDIGFDSLSDYSAHSAPVANSNDLASYGSAFEETAAASKPLGGQNMIGYGLKQADISPVQQRLHGFGSDNRESALSLAYNTPGKASDRSGKDLTSDHHHCQPITPNQAYSSHQQGSSSSSGHRPMSSTDNNANITPPTKLGPALQSAFSTPPRSAAGIGQSVAVDMQDGLIDKDVYSMERIYGSSLDSGSANTSMDAPYQLPYAGMQLQQQLHNSLEHQRQELAMNEYMTAASEHQQQSHSSQLYHPQAPLYSQSQLPDLDTSAIPPYSSSKSVPNVGSDYALSDANNGTNPSLYGSSGGMAPNDFNFPSSLASAFAAATANTSGGGGGFNMDCFTAALNQAAGLGGGMPMNDGVPGGQEGLNGPISEFGLSGMGGSSEWEFSDISKGIARLQSQIQDDQQFVPNSGGVDIAGFGGIDPLLAAFPSMASPEAFQLAAGGSPSAAFLQSFMLQGAGSNLVGGGDPSMINGNFGTGASLFGEMSSGGFSQSGGGGMFLDGTNVGRMAAYPASLHQPQLQQQGYIGSSYGNDQLQQEQQHQNNAMIYHQQQLLQQQQQHQQQQQQQQNESSIGSEQRNLTGDGLEEEDNEPEDGSGEGDVEQTGEEKKEGVLADEKSADTEDRGVSEHTEGQQSVASQQRGSLTTTSATAASSANASTPGSFNPHQSQHFTGTVDTKMPVAPHPAGAHFLINGGLESPVTAGPPPGFILPEIFHHGGGSQQIFSTANGNIAGHGMIRSPSLYPSGVGSGSSMLPPGAASGSLSQVPPNSFYIPPNMMGGGNTGVHSSGFLGGSGNNLAGLSGLSGLLQRPPSSPSSTGHPTITTLAGSNPVHLSLAGNTLSCSGSGGNLLTHPQLPATLGSHHMAPPLPPQPHFPYLISSSAGASGTTSMGVGSTASASVATASASLSGGGGLVTASGVNTSFPGSEILMSMLNMSGGGGSGGSFSHPPTFPPLLDQQHPHVLPPLHQPPPNATPSGAPSGMRSLNSAPGLGGSKQLSHHKHVNVVPTQQISGGKPSLELCPGMVPVMSAGDPRVGMGGAVNPSSQFLSGLPPSGTPGLNDLMGSMPGFQQNTGAPFFPNAVGGNGGMIPRHLANSMGGTPGFMDPSMIESFGPVSFTGMPPPPRRSSGAPIMSGLSSAGGATAATSGTGSVGQIHGVPSLGVPPITSSSLSGLQHRQQHQQQQRQFHGGLSMNGSGGMALGGPMPSLGPGVMRPGVAPSSSGLGGMFHSGSASTASGMGPPMSMNGTLPSGNGGVVGGMGAPMQQPNWSGWSPITM